MPFNQKPQKFNAKINAVTIGSGDKTVTIGGENSFPFYTFDAPTENTPKIGVEISDLGLDEFSEGVKAYYEGAVSMADIAKKAAAIEGADFVALILDGGDPNGANKSIDELIEVVKEVAGAIDCPLVVEGCKNVEKDAELLPKVAEVLQGRNASPHDRYPAAGIEAQTHTVRASRLPPVRGQNQQRLQSYRPEFFSDCQGYAPALVSGRPGASPSAAQSACVYPCPPP